VNLFERAIAGIAPQWGLARARARMALRVFDSYEAVEKGRLRKDRRDRRSANAQNERSAEELRTMARHLDQNFDIAAGILDTIVANVVGAGIAPEPQILLTSGEPAEELNRRLLSLWNDWIALPEVTRSFDYYTLQRMMIRSWLRDGETFGQLIIGPTAGLDHGTIVPFSIEALEADLCPLDYRDENRSIIQGVEVNAWGQARAYWMYKQHPGDTYLTSGAARSPSLGRDLKRVPADRVLHLKLARRLHQLRGVSLFAPVMNRLDDIKEIDESERIAARVAAAMAAYIKKGTPDLYNPEVGVGTDGKPNLRSMEFVPGMIFDDLLPGEDVGTIDTKRPNNALIPFRDAQLRAAAAGVGAGFSSISKNYEGSYSSQRQELVEQFVIYRAVSQAAVARLCQPTWDGFIDAATLSGAVTLPQNVDRETLYNCTHALPPMPWIDPQKEVQAAISAVQNRFTSRSRVIRQRGDNPDEINREIARDHGEDERLGFGPVEPDGSVPAEEPPEQDDAPARQASDDAVARVSRAVADLRDREDRRHRIVVEDLKKLRAQLAR
jgi:lambda family phage portal protein